MRSKFQEFDFPQQRIPNSKKDKDWGANCCDWIIAQGMMYRQDGNVEKRYAILNGDIPDEYYAKTLNPFNTTDKKLTRFPSEIRNYDLMKGNIRRYVGEYIKNPHEFIVNANNPEVVLGRNAKIREEVFKLAKQRIAEMINEQYQQYVQNGGDESSLENYNPGADIDFEAVVKEISENYIDDISAQGQNILNLIQDLTQDELLYADAYFDYVTFGECYTYTDVNGSEIHKKRIKPIDAYPIPNDERFVEDFDGFAYRRKLTHHQILDEFGDYLSEEELKFIEDNYSTKYSTESSTYMKFHDFYAKYPNLCTKYTPSQRKYYEEKNILVRDSNADLYDVWHVVWKGFNRKAIVSYVTEEGFISERMENDDYKLNKELGDIKIEYIYETQVYESIRIGTRETGIYPYGARAIAYNRKGKLPYNGLMEIIPGFGRFSIVDIILPYQIFYNIVAFYRELAIARYKLDILMIAKSLLGKAPEKTIYKMITSGVLYIDDTDDDNMLRAQQVRPLTASNSEYLTTLSNLLQEIEAAAEKQVDMTPQRYGEIANSAGKAVTEEAVARGSMGTVIIEFIMDCLRERDYERDIDYSKIAWIDGLNTSYKDIDGNLKYLSLDVDKHMFADYGIKIKASARTRDKLRELKQFAFSAAQNGDMQMAIAAITSDNISSIKNLVKKFDEEKNKHEKEMEEIKQQTNQMLQQYELEKIHVKGEEDRKTKELEGYIEEQIALIKADSNMISYENGMSIEQKDAAVNRLNENRNELEKGKLQLERQRMALDAYNKVEDRRLKEKDIDTKLQIAKTNRNRYDK